MAMSNEDRAYLDAKFAAVFGRLNSIEQNQVRNHTRIQFAEAELKTKVSKEEFGPVKRLVYGGIALLLVTVLAALLKGHLV